MFELAKGTKWLSGHDVPSVKDARFHRGMSQGQLAKKLNITQGHLSHIENFRVMPSPLLMTEILQVLEIPEDFKLRFSDVMRNKPIRKNKIAKNETMNALLDFELKHGPLVLLTEENLQKLRGEHERSQRVDDRVCMHYVVDRLEDCLKEDEEAVASGRFANEYLKLRKTVEAFKEECVYNLGVNTRIKKEAVDG